MDSKPLSLATASIPGQPPRTDGFIASSVLKWFDGIHRLNLFILLLLPKYSLSSRKRSPCNEGRRRQVRSGLAEMAAELALFCTTTTKFNVVIPAIEFCNERPHLKLELNVSVSCFTILVKDK